MPIARFLGREPSNMSETPIRLPDAATVKAVLASLDPATADSDLAPALSTAVPGFAFLETRVMREVGLDYVKEKAFMELNPDWFHFVPREVRMF